jgi:uncharacterized membrane protein YoaK (UPF0700 family)
MLDSRRNIALACALSALAGYVDGIGFLHLGGLFVSFMSGNSTRMGVSLAEGHWSSASEALGLVALFVIGAAVGSLIVNAVFQIEGGAGLGLTDVTGALVKVGQLAAEALRGGARWGWGPNLLLWAALVAGSLCGAVAYHWINLAAIWFAAASALTLSAVVAVTIHL